MMNRGIAAIDDIAIRAGAMSVVEDEVFVARGSTWNYAKGTQEPSSPRTEWRQLGFDDGSWGSATLPIGYGEPEIVVTELTDMRENYFTVF